jgi:HTH-type transcriptional regulator/antitoxin HigA
MIAVIKSDAQYEEVLERVTSLALLDPTPDSAEGREFEVLTVLLQDYERHAFPLAAPSPLAAIRLRMEQLGLAPKDLIPYLGSRSKVSEVLSGKRPLSLSMIRALHSGLAIPLESLVSDEPDEESTVTVDWDRFPIREMVKRGWLQLASARGKGRIGYADAQEMMERFLRSIGGPSTALGVLHKTDSVRTAPSADRYALAAWACYVRQRAERVELSRSFRPTDWTDDGFRELRNLSRFDVGPRLAVQYLEERGIVVDVVPHLPRTRLDGAALLRRDGTPVIALTIRHDRVDNFWFTLFHELMHVIHHLHGRAASPQTSACFLDDLDVAPDQSAVEKEADESAREALVPAACWEASAVRFAVAPATVSQLAREVGVSDAVVAGRVRYEQRNYRLLSSLIGSGQVRQLFPEVVWPTNN